jgi:hypothetical protein
VEQEHSICKLLAEELPRSVRDDQLLFRLSVVVNDVDLALDQDDQVVALITLGEQRITAPNLGLLAIAT